MLPMTNRLIDICLILLLSGMLLSPITAAYADDSKPTEQTTEIERILVPGGHLFISDLRRSWLGLLEDEIKAGLTIAEARKLFNQSDLRSGDFAWGLIWWKFEGRR